MPNLNHPIGLQHALAVEATHTLEHAGAAQILRYLMRSDDAWIRAALLDREGVRVDVHWCGHTSHNMGKYGPWPLIGGILRNKSKYRAFTFTFAPGELTDTVSRENTENRRRLAFKQDDLHHRLRPVSHSLISTENTAFAECFRKFSDIFAPVQGDSSGSGGPWHGDLTEKK